MTAYGMAKWPDRLARIPQAHEGAVIARVQSMRTRGGHVPEPLSFAESQAYLRRVDRVRKRGVTVPQPLCRPAQKNTSTPVECAQAGSIQEIKHERSSDS